MPTADDSAAYPRVPLTRFHMNAAEFLELSLQNPVIITANSEDRHVVLDIAYFRRLEVLAAERLRDAMDVKPVRAAEMSDEDRAALMASKPSAAEIASDCWDS